ncbi:class I SAM-dependent methyltransferase [Candidatus Saganbacteria bacterium]|nr:class I SAM-dependent methyltransferase [Candidatus Saganbacteria bacterium]
MLEKEYETMYNVEDNHWWYVGMHRIFFDILKKYLFNRGERGQNLKILDAGCGTGKVMESLSKYGETLGIDYSEYAIVFCKKRGFNSVFQCSIEKLQFPDEYFDVITCFDVLSNVDDKKALDELYRVCKPGGLILINVVAWQSLFSTHDMAVGVKRRYSKNELEEKINKSGLIIKKITYLNCFLFPLIALVRILKKRMINGNIIESDLVMPIPILNFILTRVLYLEAFLARKINLPIGLSLFCVAERQQKDK